MHNCVSVSLWDRIMVVEQKEFKVRKVWMWMVCVACVHRGGNVIISQTIQWTFPGNDCIHTLIVLCIHTLIVLRLWIQLFPGKLLVCDQSSIYM